MEPHPRDLGWGWDRRGAIRAIETPEKKPLKPGRRGPKEHQSPLSRWWVNFIFFWEFSGPLKLGDMIQIEHIFQPGWRIKTPYVKRVFKRVEQHQLTLFLDAPGWNRPLYTSNSWKSWVDGGVGKMKPTKRGPEDQRPKVFAYSHKNLRGTMPNATLPRNEALLRDY